VDEELFISESDMMYSIRKALFSSFVYFLFIKLITSFFHKTETKMEISPWVTLLCTRSLL
jgi:phosphate starvation-inducible membrane PsiE